jgi:hypothetical protein
MSSLPLLVALTLAAAAAGKAPDKPAFNRHTGLYEPPFSELERAVVQGDRADVARWAARIGPARLSEALRGTDRARTVAALEAVGALPGNVRLLDVVTPLVAAGDPAVAERAVRAVGQMLDGGEPRRLEEWDVPSDAVSRGCRALSDAAARPQAPAELRLSAIEALTDATLLCRPPSLALLTDGNPAVRRAALLAQRPRDEVPAQSLRQALGDADPGVVSAAAVAWCRHRLLAGLKPPTAAELARLPAAPPPGTASNPPLRELASAETTPVEDAVELLPCLALSPDAADRQALEQLKKSKAPPLRARATELTTPGKR